MCYTAVRATAGANTPGEDLAPWGMGAVRGLAGLFVRVCFIAAAQPLACRRKSAARIATTSAPWSDRRGRSITLNRRFTVPRLSPWSDRRGRSITLNAARMLPLLSRGLTGEAARLH